MANQRHLTCPLLLRHTKATVGDWDETLPMWGGAPPLSCTSHFWTVSPALMAKGTSTTLVDNAPSRASASLAPTP
jgi:hypothetical protein